MIVKIWETKPLIIYLGGFIFSSFIQQIWELDPRLDFFYHSNCENLNDIKKVSKKIKKCSKRGSYRHCKQLLLDFSDIRFNEYKAKNGLY